MEVAAHLHNRSSDLPIYHAACGATRCGRPLPARMMVNSHAGRSGERSRRALNAPLGHVSPGHGIWQRGPIPGGYSFVRLVSLRPNPNGTLHTKQTVTMFLTLNSTGDQFGGPYEIQIVNANGDTISTSKGKVDGKLIAHPLLP